MVHRPLVMAIAGALVAASAPAAAQQPPALQGYPPPVYAPPSPPASASPPYAYHPPPAQPMPPPYWAYAPPVMERRSVAAMVAGIVMVSLGGVGLIAGTSAAVSARRVCDFTCTRQDTPGIALAVAGAVLTAAGIPVLVYGARRVRVKAATARIGAPWIAIGDPHAGKATAVGWGFQF